MTSEDLESLFSICCFCLWFSTNPRLPGSCPRNTRCGTALQANVFAPLTSISSDSAELIWSHSRTSSSYSLVALTPRLRSFFAAADGSTRSEEHTSELQSLRHLVCRLLLEKKK